MHVGMKLAIDGNDTTILSHNPQPCMHMTKLLTPPQDAHKLVLEVAEWLTASLSGLVRHELTT